MKLCQLFCSAVLFLLLHSGCRSGGLKNCEKFSWSWVMMSERGLTLTINVIKLKVFTWNSGSQFETKNQLVCPSTVMSNNSWFTGNPPKIKETCENLFPGSTQALWGNMGRWQDHRKVPSHWDFALSLAALVWLHTLFTLSQMGGAKLLEHDHNNNNLSRYTNDKYADCRRITVKK